MSVIQCAGRLSESRVRAVDHAHLSSASNNWSNLEFLVKLINDFRG